jgi:hypothetical protein
MGRQAATRLPLFYYAEVVYTNLKQTTSFYERGFIMRKKVIIWRIYANREAS